MIFGLFFAGVGMAVYADSRGKPSLDELLLSNEDVPADYAINSDLSGELTAERARRLGVPEWAEIAGNASGWTRVWDRAGTNERVGILVINTRNERAAGIANESLEKYLRSAGFHSFEVSSIDGAVGAEAERLADSEPVTVAVVGFARGSLTFTISTGPRRTSEAESATTLAIELAERQDNRASERYFASVASPDADYAGLVGWLSGAVGMYAGIAFWLAHAGDPVRRRKRRKRRRKGQPQQLPLAYTLPHCEGPAFDVGMSALALQTRAVPLFIMEVVAGVLAIETRNSLNHLGAACGTDLRRTSPPLRQQADESAKANADQSGRRDNHPRRDRTGHVALLPCEQARAGDLTAEAPRRAESVAGRSGLIWT
jgi:hypothetical protein